MFFIMAVFAYFLPLHEIYFLVRFSLQNIKKVPIYILYTLVNGSGDVSRVGCLYFLVKLLDLDSRKVLT